MVGDGAGWRGGFLTRLSTSMFVGRAILPIWLPRNYVHELSFKLWCKLNLNFGVKGMSLTGGSSCLNQRLVGRNMTKVGSLTTSRRRPRIQGAMAKALGTWWSMVSATFYMLLRTP